MSAAPSLRRFRWAYAAWLLGVVAYFLPSCSWNPLSRFDLVRSVVERHTVSIDWLASDTGDKAFDRGHWFSDKAPLPAVVAMPVYAVVHALDGFRGRAPTFLAIGEDAPEDRIVVNDTFRHDLYLCSLATAGAAGVAIGLWALELLRRRGSLRMALFGSAAMTLGTPVLPYATSFYGHTCAAGCLFGAIVALDPAAGPGAPPASRLRWAGLGLAAAVGCEYITAIPVVVVLAWLVASTPRQRLVLTLRELVVGGLLPVLLVGLVHAACYGAPWRTGYSHIADPEFAAGHAQGLLGVRLPSWEALAGLLVGSERGLLYVAPVLAVLGAWWASSLATDAWISRAAGSAVLALLLANAGYYMWWGGAAAVPRHLVPVVALFAFGVPAVWSQPSSRAIAAAFAVGSIANMLAITAVGLEAPEGNVLWWTWQAVRYGAFSDIQSASNLGIELGLPRASSMGPLLAWVLIGGRLLWKEAARLDGAAPEDASPADPAVAGA